MERTTSKTKNLNYGGINKIPTEGMPLSEDAQGFHSIDWRRCERRLETLQDAIARAWINDDYPKVKRIQSRLLHDFSARAIAVRKVTSNKGRLTPGIDGELWNSPAKKWKAIINLKMNPNLYRASPVRRIWIPKPGSSEKRPLGIPTMTDRAYQTLMKLSVEPIVEVISDKFSFGFRPSRGCQDAMSYLNILLSNPRGGNWILEADIKGFFDNLNHDWMIKNINIINTNVMREWLKAKIIDKDWTITDPQFGTPQGSVISPILANLALNGLEQACINSVQKARYFKGQDGRYNKKSTSIHVARYADDFVVTAKYRDDLKDHVLPTIISFLKERGLEVRWDKTRIVRRENGFDFLGWNFRSYTKPGKRRGIFLIRPSTKSIKKIKTRIKTITENSIGLDQKALIVKLNPVLRGWANYHKSTSAKRAFSKISMYTWQCLFKWCKKKSPKTPLRKLKSKYFVRKGNRDWIFQTEDGTTLFEISSTPIRRHIICKDRNPFLLENKEYFQDRKIRGAKTSTIFSPYEKSVLKRTKYTCLVCNKLIGEDDPKEIHHIVSKKEGGSNKMNNLMALHESCHKQVTYSSSKTLIAEFKLKGVIARPERNPE